MTLVGSCLPSSLLNMYWGCLLVSEEPRCVTTVYYRPGHEHAHCTCMHVYTYMYMYMYIYMYIYNAHAS